MLIWNTGTVFSIFCVYLLIQKRYEGNVSTRRQIMSNAVRFNEKNLTVFSLVNIVI